MALTFGGKKRPGGEGPRTPLDPLEQQVTDRIAAVIRALGNATDVDAYVAAIQSLDPDRLEALLRQVTIGRLGDRIEEVLHSVLMSGAEAEALRIIRETPIPAVTPAAVLEPTGVRLPNGIFLPGPVVPEAPTLGFGIGPDMDRTPEGRLADSKMLQHVDARATEYARTRSAQLVSQIDESNRLAIRRVITESFTQTSTVDQTARKLRSMVGLHSRWAKAVINFDDRNYRSFIKDGMSTDAARARADVLTKRYRDKLIRRRAEMIARTEIMQAQNAARQMAWDAGNRAGYVDGASMKVWSTAPMGSRYGDPCPICQENAGKEVPWNGAFPDGHTMPPAHPHCRCTAVLVPPKRGLTGLPSQDMQSWLDQLDAMDVEKHLAGQHDQKTHGHGSGGGMRLNPGDPSKGEEQHIEYGGMYVPTGIPVMDGSSVDDARIREYPNEVHGAGTSFAYWDGNYATRVVSARIMGLEGGFKPKGATGSAGVGDGPDVTGFFRGEVHADALGPFDHSIARTRVRDAVYLLDAAGNGKRREEDLWRGIRLKDGDPRLSAKVGDEFEMPVSAFATIRVEAEVFAANVSVAGVRPSDGHARPLLINVQPGARGYSTGEIEMPGGEEVLVQGRFRVTAVPPPEPVAGNVSSGIDMLERLTLKQVAHYDVITGEWVSDE